MWFAQVYSGVTKGLKRVPWLDRAIVGENVIPEGWTILHNLSPKAVAELPSVEFEGDKKGILNRLPIPRFYKKLGVAAIDAAKMQELRESGKNTRDAVVAIFGQTAVMAVLEEGSQFGADPKAPEQELVAFRIGHGALAVSVGVFDKEHGFRAVESSIRAQGRPPEFEPEFVLSPDMVKV